MTSETPSPASTTVLEHAHAHEHDHADCCGHDHHHGHSHAPVTLVRQGPKVGRNDPCPCGSGKKHKKCCLEAVAPHR